MIEMKAKISGLNELLNKLDRIEQAAERGQKIGLKKAAFLIEREAKITAPTDTGRYKSSISTSFENNNLTAHVGPHVYYASYLEFGTGKWNLNGPFRTTGRAYNVKDKRSKYFGYHWTEGMKPKQIMKKAYSNTEERAREIVKEEIKKSIDSVK